MFTELFAALSIVTGLDPVPLQNLACGVTSAVLSPCLLYGARRAYAACQRPEQPVSVLASRILDQLAQPGWAIDDGAVRNGTIRVHPAGIIQVNGISVEGDLTGHERRLILRAAAAVRETLDAEAEDARQARIMAALHVEEDDVEADDEDEVDEDGAWRVPGYQPTMPRTNGPTPVHPVRPMQPYLMKR